MISRWGFLIAFACSAAPLGWAQGNCTVDVGYSGDNALVTYTVTAPAGTAVKDCHWLPPKGSTIKNPSGTPTMPASGGTWSMDATSSNKGQVAKRDGAGIAGGQSGGFTFTFPMGGDTDNHKTKFWKSLKAGTFTATSDGTNTVTPGNTVFTGGPTTGGPVVTWPSAFIRFKEPPVTTVARVGTTIAVEFESSFYGGQSFKAHAATALSLTSNGSDNPLGVGIDTTQGVPTGWNLTFSPQLDRSELLIEQEASLDEGLVTVTIPNDSNLVGEYFYLVVSCDTDGNGTRTIFSRPMKVKLRDVNSTTSSLELLPYFLSTALVARFGTRIGPDRRASQ